MKKLLALIVGVVLGAGVSLIIIWIANGSHLPSDEEMTIARYSGGKVSYEQFQAHANVIRYMTDDADKVLDNIDFQRAALEDYVMFQMAWAELTEKERAASRDWAWEQLRERKAKLNQTETGLAESKLKQLQLTDEAIVNDLIWQQAANRRFERTITDDTVRSAYQEQLKKDPNFFTAATVRAVFVPLRTGSGSERSDAEARRLADEAYERLKQGESAAGVADAYRDGNDAIPKGGLILNGNNLSALPEPYLSIATGLGSGQFSKPVQTDGGYVIVVVEHREVKSVEAVKEAIRTQLIQQSVKRFAEQELKTSITYLKVPMKL